LTVLVPTSATYAQPTVEADGLIASAPAPFDVLFPSSQTIDTTSMAVPANLPTGSNSTGVAIADLDGDGKPDLVVANYGAGTISVYRNIGTNGTIAAGSFAPKVDFVVGAGPTYLAVGDIDGDGKPDVAVANNNGTTISIFRNISTPGSFTTNSLGPRVDLTVGSAPNQLVICDVDGGARQWNGEWRV
jgi:hypothetical protein